MSYSQQHVLKEGTNNKSKKKKSKCRLDKRTRKEKEALWRAESNCFLVLFLSQPILHQQTRLNFYSPFNFTSTSSSPSSRFNLRALPLVKNISFSSFTAQGFPLVSGCVCSSHPMFRGIGLDPSCVILAKHNHFSFPLVFH